MEPENNPSIQRRESEDVFPENIVSHRVESARRSEAFSPAFLSPRMWNEEDMLLPPSSEVPKRPVIRDRDSQDKGCFGLYTFIMVLFLIQGIAAILGANYQLPHEFELCEARLAQEKVAVARDIPEAEVIQHALEGRHENFQTGGKRLARLKVVKKSHANWDPWSHRLRSVAGKQLAEEPGSFQVSHGHARKLLSSNMLPQSLKQLLKDIKLQASTGLPSHALRNGTSLAQSNSTSHGESNSTKKEKEQNSEEGDFQDDLSPEQVLENAYKRVRNASGIVALLAFSSIVFGAIWVLLLGRFTTAFVYITLSALPIALFCSAISLFLLGVHMVWPITLLVVMTLSLAIIYLVKERIAFTAALLTCASKALVENYSVLVISIFLSLIQVMWLGACFLFIALSFMSGVAVRAKLPNGEQRCEWQTDGWAYVGMGFISVVLLWTNSILEEVKRYTVCGAIGLWYFAEMPKRRGNESSRMRDSSSTSFGSICFSALVSSFCETLKLIFQPRGLTESSLPGKRKSRSSSSVQESVWFCLEDVIGFVNRFAVPLMAISGYPFCHSAKVTSLLLHRNHLAALVADVSPAVILRTGALVVALCAALTGWLLSNAYVEWAVLQRGQLRIVHLIVARFVFVTSFCISSLVLNFFASVLLDAMDAMFLLYAMDRDHRTMMPRGEELHNLLSQQQIGRPISGVHYTPRGWTFLPSQPNTSRQENFSVIRSSSSSRGSRNSRGEEEEPSAPAEGQEEGTLV
ncbi:hypothetical protein GUITHDRAFT_163997 [Guillardia theta CCMP2712]|uniref:Choline transporter-like protein n=1 Tax=Guillardia theta (strain CCMP2712) TaxID=905079 RepID=L1J3V8_GUITC|nr:hypothetical protein GUITHDRAFT_163997 [Guillardia theta CCMP2712]EKX43012.1 hypothetical protein GUITHDRAFT_163997 [Guillardia theta CCMP2712]|eukprot:XP_005829992.1 hypothetical protein GUITHDRAFT_163997 [Guillardia theta CCMP2712]